MKKFALLLILLLTACGSATEPAPPTPEIIDLDAEPSALQVMFASDDFHVGTPRIPIILFDGADAAQNIASVAVRLYDVSVEPPAVAWEGIASEYPDGAIGYWVVEPEIETAGDWGLDILAETDDGVADSYQRLISVADVPSSPALGTIAPPSNNRTLATNDINELSSGFEPNEALYQVTVADAIASGKPTVVTLATPAFCQTQICAPVVNIVEDTFAEVGEAANFIHLEIYDDFQELTNTPEVAEWGLTSEPWTFVLDGDGTVMARLGGPISKQEILQYLEPLIEG